MWPEPYATIAREREKGTPAAEVAEMLGVHETTLRSRVREWNRNNPRNPLPRQRYVNTAVYMQAVELHKQGLSRTEVARIMGVSEIRVTNMWSHARARGALPRIVPKAEKGGRAAYEAYYCKGAAPRMGSFREILDPLSAKEITQLVDCIDPKNDTTLAHAIARIIKEHLRDNKTGR